MMKHFETGGDPKFLLKSRGLNLFQENVYIYESYICHEWNDHTLHSFSVFFFYFTDSVLKNSIVTAS